MLKMKQGGNIKNHSGFTIVETLIVLAVSAGLFLVAALYIGGKQAKTEFQVGVRDIQTRLQQAINDTASGYYPHNDKFTCTVPTVATENLGLKKTGGSPPKGSNDDCIFIGKVLYFNKDTLYIYSLAGARTVGDKEVKTAKDAHATAIAESDDNSINPPDATEVYKLPSGFELVGVSHTSAAPSPMTTSGVAILSSLADFSSSATGLQQFTLGAISGVPTPPLTQKIIANTINAEITTSPSYATLQQVKFCLNNGATDKSALITIGGEGSIVVRADIKTTGPLCG